MSFPIYLSSLHMVYYKSDEPNSDLIGHIQATYLEFNLKVGKAGMVRSAVNMTHIFAKAPREIFSGGFFIYVKFHFDIV